ncbi:hypothetical protein [Coralloluteibacterium thermophilus]|uniref:DUF1795 domain-containing protein n=1 Tax=Coralloluteibacterium thermophilum TaxID=2707049 RepID=A0ABV9NLQ7_9GAMM
MSTILRLAAGAALLAVAFAAGAATYRNPAVALEVPEGFEGPTVETPAPGAETAAFVRRDPGSPVGALLQVTTQTFSSSPAAGMDPDRAAITYLREFLGGIERRRSGFAASQPMMLEVDGHRMARANWTGNHGEVAMRGTMYALIVGDRLVVLHAQDLADPSRRHVEAAMRAIENLRVAAR